MYKEMYLNKRNEILSTLKNVGRGNYLQVAFFKDRIELETSKWGFARIWVDSVVSFNLGIERSKTDMTADELDAIVDNVLKPYEN
jgi:hypothetical protein